MPELPEVETTLRGLRPHLEGQRIIGMLVRQPRLRQPVPVDLAERLTGRMIKTLTRRGKYLLVELDQGSLLLHLGMSGSLRLVQEPEPYRPHDHLELALVNGKGLRFHDPRRFGLFCWIPQTPEQAMITHPLLCELGLEPLSDRFDGQYLWQTSRKRSIAIKPFIMDGRVVVGVGNIYATESLFHARIHPACPCDRIDLDRYQRLAETIRLVLLQAIEHGGTTLRDFVGESGAPGYFTQSLMIYGRADKACKLCGSLIKRIKISGRASFYCPRCQG